MSSASSGFPAGAQGLGSAMRQELPERIQPGNCFHSSGQTFGQHQVLMLIPIKLCPVGGRKEFGTLSLEFSSMKVSLALLLSPALTATLCLAAPWEAEEKQSCNAAGLLGIKMCMLGIFFPSEHIRNTIFIPQFWDDSLFKQSSKSRHLLWWHSVYKSRIAAGTAWKCGRK